MRNIKPPRLRDSIPFGFKSLLQPARLKGIDWALFMRVGDVYQIMALAASREQLNITPIDEVEIYTCSNTGKWERVINNYDGYMVMTPDRGVGMARYRDKLCVPYDVFFGESGPVYYYSADQLRLATRDEIREAGLEGVGCKNA